MTVSLSHECAGVREAGRLVAWREHALGAAVPVLSFPHWATAIIVVLGVPGTIAGQRQMRAMNSEAGQKAVSYLRDPGTALVFTFWAIGELETK